MGTAAGFIFAVALALGVVTLRADNEPALVRIRRVEGRYQLERDGRQFFIKGAVGTYRLDLLAASGGNSVRAGPHALDEAHRHGLTCLVGLPLANPRKGFDYEDCERVNSQFEKIRELVKRYRSHPALLMWAIGNEPEIGTSHSQRVPLWHEVNRIAQMIKTEDPSHPVITVLGDAYKRILPELDEHCTALDAVGLNSYNDMLTLPEDVARAGWTRPYVVTEFGPRGHWQVPKTPWRVPIEDSSTEKAEFYLKAYRHAVEGRPQCLGAYAFYWSHKQEKTHTWYGMFLPDGNETAAVETMRYLWTGRWPTNLCPRIGPGKIRIVGSQSPQNQQSAVMMAGKGVSVEVDVQDPDNDDLVITWDFRGDTSDNPNVGGDYEPPTAPIPDVIVRTHSGGRIADLRLPNRPGKFRLFVYANDGHGHAATANLPVLLVAPSS
ncbi:MAG: hypothetical protein GX456_18665 [Verrucomicrobia bacterium]|nr:hypothetical protein [Verrucomicrobiota bacterium]